MVSEGKNGNEYIERRVLYMKTRGEMKEEQNAEEERDIEARKCR